MPAFVIQASTIKAGAIDCLFQTILGVLLPFYLASAGGNAGQACAAIMELINAHDAVRSAEPNLVGRLVGFITAAVDNLRLSMQPGLSANKVLPYRNNAVAPNRDAESCRGTLEALQTKLLCVPCRSAFSVFRSCKR